MTTLTNTRPFTDLVNEVIATIDRERAAIYKRDLANVEAPVLTADFGPKYIRLVNMEHGQRASAYGFLDYDGNIYKAAGWKAPAKHIRGSIFDENHSWGKAFGVYGVAYLR